jgi:hypothetical protein
MSSEQCALNADGSLKDANQIEWFGDPDDPQPLPSAANAQLPFAFPSTAPPAQPLGRGRCNKVTNRFVDAVAHERLGSDKDVADASGVTKLPRL